MGGSLLPLFGSLKFFKLPTHTADFKRISGKKLSDKTYDPAVDNLLKVLTDNVNGNALVLMDF